MSKVLGILTGGGDVPGLNPAIKAVVSVALDNGYKVIGFRRGWGGLMEYNVDDPATHKNAIPLTNNEIRVIDRTGGTFLHTSRTNPQNVKANVIPEFLIGSAAGVKIKEDTYDYTAHVLRVIQHLGITNMVTIGGDDTLSYSYRLHKEGIPVVAIPKTMDNDVMGTDYCIGFSTAITRSIEVINNMRTSLGSHERIGIIELFGRNSGETSLVSAYLSGADRALIPEVEFDMDKLAYLISADRESSPSNYAVLTVSEGATMFGGEIIESGEMDAYGHRKLGGIGTIVAEEIKRRTKTNIMYQQLGYVMRSGTPDTLDRMVSISYGNLAAQALLRGENGKLVGINDGKYTLVPIETVLSGKKTVEVERYYDAENYRPQINNVLGLPMFLN